MNKIIKKLCIFTEGYPTDTDPKCPFVDQLVCQFADMGIHCTVIDPLSITKNLVHRYETRPRHRIRITEKGNKIDVYSPPCISVSTRRLGLINTSVVTLREFTRAANSIVKAKKADFDVFYGHFIFPSGIIAATLGQKYDIPAFFAYGENTNYTIDYLGINKTRELLRGIKGVISVSTANKENLIRKNIVPDDIIGIFPNSINSKLFYRRDKLAMRKKYNLPEDAFIVAFVGRFVEIKGANRLSQALEIVGTDKVKSLFIGTGDVKPNCSGILLQGLQPHNNVPELLSASDVFVLPTLAEGCCNAIIEAMACGLPIISSKHSFNDDILDETCSIRIDPNNAADIANAINLIINNENLRSTLANGAVKKAQMLNIETRAKKIVAFMESIIKGENK